MMINEVTLLAYVEGELPPAAAREVERALDADAELQRQERALRASRLPYQAAFAAQRLPEMSGELRERVQSWIAVDESASPAPMTRRRWPLFGAALAASFVMGLWVPVSIRLNQNAPDNQTWVQAIARYQALSVRETVERVNDDPEQARALLASFAAEDGLRITIPDLSFAGFSFRRAQRLAAGNAPMIRMEYLPLSGKPISLCVLAARHGDKKAAMRRIDGMQVSTWRRNGLEFVMVADMPEREFSQLAQRVARGDLPVLYGQREG